jgi:hypothetical protein
MTVAGLGISPVRCPIGWRLDHCTPPDDVSWQINQPASGSIATPATPR